MLMLYWKDKDTGAATAISFDAVTSETHEALLQITSHPVEEGVNVTDHARAEPRKLTIEGFVSNKPLMSNLLLSGNPADANLLAADNVKLDIPKKQTSLAQNLTPGGITQAVTGAISGLLNPAPKQARVFKASSDFPDRARDVYTKLLSAQQARALIRAVTKFGTIENLLIERLASPFTTEVGNGANFQIDLQQIRIVKSEEVEAPVSAESRGALESSKGSKATDSKNDEKNKKMLQSVAAASFDGAAGLIGGLAGKAGGF